LELREVGVSKEVAISLACRDHDYRWPRTLSSGVMFFDGYRITIDEFNAWAEKFFDEAPTRKKRSQCDCERFDYCRQHGHAP
jgi:hypothetical protein